MEALCKSLVFALAYLGTVARESDDDEDNDVAALERMAFELNSMTSAEKKSLLATAKAAIASEQKAKKPNHSLISGYNSVLEQFAE